MATYTPFREVLAESLKDPEVKAEWDRTTLARTISNWTILYRTRAGLSQTGLARVLGWKQPQVARLEIGEHEPSYSTLIHLSRVLKTHIVIRIEQDQLKVTLSNPHYAFP